MANKYDTNPLDPNFPKKAAHSAEAQQTETLPNLDAKTRTFNGAAVTEEPTLRYDNASFAQYSSVYAEQPQGAPAMYQTTQLSANEKPTDRKISGVGLPENVLMVLPYTPFYIGLVAGVLELLFVPQSETKVRFHAAQGLAANIAILFVSFVLGFISNFSSWAGYGTKVFWVAMLVGLIVSMVRIWQGKVVHYEFLDGLTNWLSDKIKIKKQ
jgi:uncharacterized membrane protein